MQRDLMKKLVEWKTKTNRKPLILNGARQVGKTWLLKEFGKEYFDNVAYVNFDTSGAMKAQFEHDFKIDRIVSAIELATEQKIVPNKTLIILDEIQECPRALTSLKYFNEDAPGFAVAAAGSLLGVTIHAGTGFPVGKVESLNLNPLSFTEFLKALGKEQYEDVIKKGDTQLLNSFSKEFERLLKLYYVVGGMPEVVSSYVATQNFQDVAQLQNQILGDYEFDVSKHLNRTETEYALAAYKSIPHHLSQENKKFIFGHISESARASNFRSGITWLTQAGLVVRVPRISKPGMPLCPYADDSGFKLFLLDIGLFCAMAQVDPKTILDGNKIFEEFKGALTEQYVCQQLIAENNLTPYYWSAEKSTGEIDFLVQDSNKVFAIETKAEENLRSKSLRAFKLKHPSIYATRFSLSGYRKQDWMVNVPLYACSNINLWA